jgi:hypothetical protein
MSIPGTVEALLSSEAPLALRLTGQLLLGVVRIYARKVAYLHQVSSCSIAKHRQANQASKQWPCISPHRTAQLSLSLSYHSQDCNDALVKIRLAFRRVQNATELDEDLLMAPAAAITLLEGMERGHRQGKGGQMAGHMDDLDGYGGLMMDEGEGGEGPSAMLLLSAGAGGMQASGMAHSMGATSGGMIEIELDLIEGKQHQPR